MSIYAKLLYPIIKLNGHVWMEICFILLEYLGIWIIWGNWPAWNIIKVIDLVSKEKVSFTLIFYLIQRYNWSCRQSYNLIFWNLHTFISVWRICYLENARKKVNIFCNSEQLWTQCPKLIMVRDRKKVIHIPRLKFPIRFAQALFKPKGNSSERLHTLEGIWDIRAI